jgi:hypothetical protein
MKKTRNILMALFAGFLLVAAILYIGGEFLHWDMAMWESATKEQRFVCSTAMILLTVCILPLSLRLFKFKRISEDLHARQTPALLRWGSVRIVCMGLLLVVNTFLYYAFGFNSDFGYLAVVVLLCMPFVIPTMGRCMAEVSKEEDQQIEEQIEEEQIEEEPTGKENEEAVGHHSQL